MTLLSEASAMAAPVIEVMVESAAWSAEPDAAAIARRSVLAAAEAVPDSAGEVAVVLTDDDAICALNRDWRKIDKPTNVLSFPAPRRTATQGADGTPVLLGDVVIAYETTAREAAEEGKPFAHHLAHLAVHGFLHLMGYDHESEAAASDMERLETRILAGLDVPDPYLLRDRV
jgi:probable rRNA maturation factor